MTFSHKNDIHTIAKYSHIPLDHVILYKKGRYKACVDINYYYAQVEERDRSLEGFPLIVGGWRDKRNIAQGIVATSNYVARSFGIKTGMNALDAQKLCPHLLMFQVDYKKYEAISKEIHDIYTQYSPVVEPYSIDESFLDLTGIIKSYKDAIEWSKSVRNHIWAKVGLTVNIGISTTKVFAKILADLNKPNGFTIAMSKKDIEKKVKSQPVEAIMGIGNKRKKRLNSYNLFTIHDMANSRKEVIQSIFGKHIGENFWMQARGEADATLEQEGKEKPVTHGVTHMHTFPHATLDKYELWGECTRGLEQVCYRLRAHGKMAKIFTLIFRPQSMTLRKTQKIGSSFKFYYTNQEMDLINSYKQCFQKLFLRVKKESIQIRGIMVYASRLKHSEYTQMDLFPTQTMQNRELYNAIDKIRDKGKFNILQYGASKSSVKGRTHFLERCE